jgi:hypothetical protein
VVSQLAREIASELHDVRVGVDDHSGTGAADKTSIRQTLSANGVRPSAASFQLSLNKGSSSTPVSSWPLNGPLHCTSPTSVSIPKVSAPGGRGTLAICGGQRWRTRDAPAGCCLPSRQRTADQARLRTGLGAGRRPVHQRVSDSGDALFDGDAGRYRKRVGGRIRPAIERGAARRSRPGRRLSSSPKVVSIHDSTGPALNVTSSVGAGPPIRVERAPRKAGHRAVSRRSRRSHSQA